MLYVRPLGVALLLLVACDVSAFIQGRPPATRSSEIKPFSLNSACASEIRDLCELRSPYGEKAIACFEEHRPDLSAQCAEWHDARMQCKTQLEASTFEQCPECKSFCGKGLSLMHCIRAAGSRIRLLGVNEQCTDTAFFRSINRHYKLKHYTE